MPWYAIPYQERIKKIRLSRIYHVHAIPSLIFLDPNDGHVLSTNGREMILNYSDSATNDFPWAMLPIHQLLQHDLISNTSYGLIDANIHGKILFLYFSASWWVSL
jgi:hypothetical protein